MSNYLERVLGDRYATIATRDTLKSRRKPAIDLALDEYRGQQDEDNVIKSTKGIDKSFKVLAIDQMKSFIFAGHDTSSSTIAYAYHLLSLHSENMTKACAELDQVFGQNTDAIQTGESIKQNPNLLNSLPYILSIIKETLRLYTPALTIRQGQDTIVYEGVTYDTEGFQVLVLSLCMHRNADYFPSPDEFIPERFMPAPDNFQEIPKDVYRPFEKGSRDCISQQLAVLEMKIILAMPLKDFDIKADYEPWDKKLGREKPGDILDGR
jgi:cytochrome P450